MRAIGIRELRQNASVYLRRVESGETIRITDRGRAVALWVPLRRKRGIAALEAEARLSEAAGDLLALGPPLPPAPEAAPASEVLAAAREDER